MVLTGAMIVVKLFGALFKIFVLKQLSGIGAAYFNTSYTLFTPISSLAQAGFPTAVAKMVANFDVQKRYRDIKKTMRVAKILFVAVGLLGSLILGLVAYPYVTMNSMEGAFWATVAIAPSLLFLCVTSVYRGYYEGLRNMRPTAVSEIVEVVVKVLVGLVLTWAVIQAGNTQFENTGRVFGQAAETAEAAYLLIMPYAAAAAILGVTASTLAGMLYIALRHRIRGDGISKEECAAAPKPVGARSIVKSLVKIAIPISLGAFVLNLATLIDTMTITNAMNRAFTQRFEEIRAIFGSVVPKENFTPELFGTFLYGAYSFAFSIFNLIPAFTGIFGKSALPNVVNCWTAKHQEGLKRNIESTLRMSSLIAVPAGIGLSVLAKPILTLLYSSQPAEVAIACPAMQIMGISVIFLAILTPAFSILQAMDQVYLPVKLMLIGSGIKILVNLLLIPIPQVNLKGAAYGTLACYVFIATASIRMVRRTACVKLSFTSMFLKPLIAGVFCGVSAWACFGLLSRDIPQTAAVLAAVAAGGFVYLLVLLLIKGVSKQDMKMFPKGEKIAKTLEKWGLIG